VPYVAKSILWTLADGNDEFASLFRCRENSSAALADGVQ
jgi:hypothetical protein